MSQIKNIKIYSDQKYLSKGEKFNATLIPFWSNFLDQTKDIDYERFDEYSKIGKEYFTLASLSECDLAIWPGIYNENNPKIWEFLREAKKINKPTVFFCSVDSDSDIKLDNGFIFRTSFYKSKQKENEFALPAFCSDFTKKYFNGNIPFRERKDIPTVGFCGQTFSPIRLFLKKIFRKGYHQTLWARPEAIKALMKENGFKSNLIIRSGFWGHVQTRSENINLAQKQREEYVANLVNSDYALCVRGSGNFSYRFYEALSMGRIPVFVNTDCVLPFEKYIDYKKICVWVEYDEIDKLPEKILEFHNKLTNDEFIALQKRCYETWKEWLSTEGFFKNFYRHFEELIKFQQ